MTHFISELLTGLCVVTLAATLFVPSPTPAIPSGFSCVAWVPGKPGVFYLCRDTALSLAWREV